MHMESVTADVFDQVVVTPLHAYGSGAFARLNASKVERVEWLLFKDGRYRLGVTGGIRQGLWTSPFSAPFGGWMPLRADIRLEHFERAVDLLLSHVEDAGCERVQFTLPPSTYNESTLAKQSNVLLRAGFSPERLDLNYAFRLENMAGKYEDVLWRSARKNLNQARQREWDFRLCIAESEKKDAFDVIRHNRAVRGFPLHMTWEQVSETAKLIPADFFLLRTHDGVSVAAALVFHVSPGIVQVIYWGDLPEHASMRSMNYLAFRLFDHYRTHHVDLVDIGPSTDDSVPNYGLCEFKEGIGCSISSKWTFVKALKS